MGLGKQAKIINEGQLLALERHVGDSRHAARNKVILLLSYKAGLRAKEIAGLTWGMLTDPNGALTGEIHLTNKASKGKSGRIIPCNPKLLNALKAYMAEIKHVNADNHVISTQKGRSTSSQFIINLFKSWYNELCFDGCSSHSGRRTFITSAAKKISTVGGSIRDVQLLAGHSNLQTTQRYIEQNTESQKALIKLL